MVSRGFFDVAGRSDLPYLSDAKADDSSNAVQTALLGYASGFVGDAGVRQVSLHNRALCESCHNISLRCDSLYKVPEVQAACDQLAASLTTGVSSKQILQAWLASPQGSDLMGSHCASACLPLEPTANFYAGGYERPYSDNKLDLQS
jgi:hypothetical protein